MGQYDRRTQQILTGQGSIASIQYKMAPALAGSGVAFAVLAAGAGPGWGAYTDLINGGGLAVATEFWVVGLQVQSAAVIQIHDLQVYNSTLALTIGNWEVDLTAKTVNIGVMSIGPYPVYCAQPSVIQARTGGAAASAINCRLAYAIGL
jgi:hypothetical protein